MYIYNSNTQETESEKLSWTLRQAGLHWRILFQNKEKKKDKVKSLDQCFLEGKYDVVTSKVPWNHWAVTEN